MDKDHKRKFIDDLITAFHSDMIDHIEAMPNEWVGAEIRQFMVDQARDRWNWYPMDRRSKRWRSYKSEMLVNGELS